MESNKRMDTVVFIDTMWDIEDRLLKGIRRAEGMMAISIQIHRHQ